MKTLSILAILLALTGCSTPVPLVAKFPKAPQALLEPCEQLQPLAEDAKLSDVTKVVVSNYTTYYDCSLRHESLVEWYTVQKKIFEKVSK